VWADEWSAATDQKLGLKGLCSYQVTVDFLNYIRTHNIALGAGAFDVLDFMVQNVPGWTYTNYDNFPSTSCPTSTTAGDNAGDRCSCRRPPPSRSISRADGVVRLEGDDVRRRLVPANGGWHPQPGIANVSRRVLVAIVLGSTHRTIPTPYTEHVRTCGSC
jgi:hypothetical protein